MREEIKLDVDEEVVDEDEMCFIVKGDDAMLMMMGMAFDVDGAVELVGNLMVCACACVGSEWLLKD